MAARLNYAKAFPEGIHALLNQDRVIAASGLELPLLELVKTRASQLNGCAYCIDMHSKDLRAEGESEERLYLLDAWRETDFYSDRERAALAWAEAVTLISHSHVPDDVYEQARQQFTDDELAKLTLAVVSINGWNRFGIAFRAAPGEYQPTRQHEAAMT